MWCMISLHVKHQKLYQFSFDKNEKTHPCHILSSQVLPRIRDVLTKEDVQ